MENLIQGSLFSIPYWKIQSINFEEKKKELVELLKSYPEERKEFQEFATNRQNNRPGLTEQFSCIMNEEVLHFSKEIKKDFLIEQVWSISYDKGDYHPPHNHSSTGLSGVLYIDLPKDSPVTVYIQPWNDYKNDVVQYNLYPEIAEGDIVIVPSFVLHFTEPVITNNKKRIISFNMKILDADMDENFRQIYR